MYVPSGFPQSFLHTAKVAMPVVAPMYLMTTTIVFNLLDNFPVPSCVLRFNRRTSYRDKIPTTTENSLGIAYAGKVNGECIRSKAPTISIPRQSDGRQRRNMALSAGGFEEVILSRPFLLLALNLASLNHLRTGSMHRMPTRTQGGKK